MKAFAALFASLDETTKTSEKVSALVGYFATCSPHDGAWAVYFLTGHKPRQIVKSALVKRWAAEAAGVPEWLFVGCYPAVGDLGETLALLVPPSMSPARDASFTEWVENRLLTLRNQPESVQQSKMLQAWADLDTPGRFIWNKLITGSLRVGVSQLLVVRALAEWAGVAAATVAHRLMGDWIPTPAFFNELVGDDDGKVAHNRPYPFFLASQLDADPALLGPPGDWTAEWKWDGIRAQLIRRAGETFLWSRGEELVTDRYPEIRNLGDRLPDGTVIDGEILRWGPGGVRPFADLQTRIGRTTVSKKLLADVPVTLLGYDLLEWSGQDVRDRPLSWRREMLNSVAGAAGLHVSPVVTADSWHALQDLRQTSREKRVEGLMLKRLDSVYRVGRVRGDWWKWKVDPFSVDAVLLYAQKGTGKRASLFSDFTFAVWDGSDLVPFAKAYSGLTDAEMRQVDVWVNRNTTEKFGPVRTVTPELVFEIGIEGIRSSKRHKSGIAVRFPRILRWRSDKTKHEADTIDRVRALLALLTGR